MTELQVHATHCCPIHGCKYGDDDCCPVVQRTVEPTYPSNNGCEMCEHSREHSRVFTTTDVIELIEGMIQETADKATRAAMAVPGFDKINGSTGPGIRIQTMIDVKKAITDEGIRRLSR